MATLETLVQALRSHQEGDLATAERLYRQVLQTQPHDDNALHLLGMLFHQRGESLQGLEFVRQAAALCPGEVLYHSNLAVVYLALGRQEEAVACCRRALQMQPGSPDIHYNLGVALQDLGQFEGAVASYRQALQLRPSHAEAHNNLGNALRDLGRLEEAAVCFRQALQLRPTFPEALNNLGLYLADQRRPDEALTCFDQALQLRPEYAEAHYNRALIWLRKGDFSRGWPEYEWRWRCPYPDSPPRSFPQPRWDGAPLGGRTILLHDEQGLGDTLQFVRYCPVVQQRGGRVVLECQSPLVPLLARCRGIDQLVTRGDPLPPFDVEAPLLSLPGILSTRLDNIPAIVPYLYLETSVVARWHSVLGEGGVQGRHCLAR